jgi:hypothetical protein
MSVSVAEARLMRKPHGYYPTPVSPVSSNIFGSQHSGVAPSTAIPENRPVYIAPPTNSSRTGGIHD